MGQLHLSAGTRYRWDGRACVVVQVLRDGQLLVEDQSGGGQAVVTREELTAAWDRGAVRFAVRGPGVRAEGEATLATGYTIADFHLLPEAERGEAWRRYALIRPLLTLPPGARTRRAIEQHLRSAGPAGPGGGAVSRGSVERYLRAFEASGGDIRALAPSTTRRTAGESRLGTEVEGIIQGVLAECRAAPAQRTVRDVYYMVVERVRVRNQGQPPEGHIMAPVRSTIYRRVGVEGPAAILRRRPGLGERPGPRATRPPRAGVSFHIKCAGPTPRPQS